MTSQLPFANNQAARERATKYLNDRLICSSVYPDVPFNDGAAWKGPRSRSHGRYLHGLLFLVDWTGTTLADTRTTELAGREAVEVVAKWAQMHRGDRNSTGMAYHDETTAQRLISLISLKYALATNGFSGSVEPVETLMEETASLLSDDEFHSPGNNHGMYQDLALLYYSVIADTKRELKGERYFKLAMRRLRDYFSTCFTSEGVHIENTPTYHLLVTRQVENVRRIADRAGHEDATIYADLIANAERYATHILMPNGVFPPLSDTQQLDIGRSSATKFFTSPEFAYASSRGQNGVAPKDRMLILPESGYAIYRSQWGAANSTFALFTAAYNSNYHKHSDDLSLFIRSKGIDLLTEAGPFGYDYQDPLTKYAYSQYGHNSLVVDGRSLPRTDSRKDRVTLKTVEQRGDGFIVVGTNGRYDDVVHERTVMINDASGLPAFELTDVIKGANDHRYELLWNLGTEVRPVLHGQGFELFHRGEKILDLHIQANVATSLSITRGRKKPTPLGWKFPKFGEAVPAGVVSIKFSGRNPILKTNIRLADFTYQDRGLVAQGTRWKRHRDVVPVNYLLCRATEDASRKLVVLFSAMGAPGDFNHNYKETLDEVDVNVLYLLDDFGIQGAYYLTDHRSTHIFQSVQNLIKKIAQDLGVPYSEIAMAGSEEGGAAALIHGSSLPAGNIMVGSPQTKIGSFVGLHRPKVLEFMAGGTSQEDIDYMDRAVMEAVADRPPSTKISIVAGEADHFLPEHVMPLLEHLRNDDWKHHPVPTLTTVPGFGHEERSELFRNFLRANLNEQIHGGGGTVPPYSLAVDSKDRVNLKIYTTGELHLAYRLYQGREVVEEMGYTPQTNFISEQMPKGTYRVRVFLRNVTANVTEAFTTYRVTV
ncbi:heparinase II/III domain-containing protein [Arthrobacter monumenti]